MKTPNFLDRFEEANGAKIEKMFWIAGSLESGDLKWFIDEMQDEDIKKCFPKLTVTEYEDTSDLLYAIIDKGYHGLVAEIQVPEARNFTYGKDGEPNGWGVFNGVSRIGYAYGENLEELMVQVEELSETIFNEYVAEDKLKRSNLSDLKSV